MSRWLLLALAMVLAFSASPTVANASPSLHYQFHSLSAKIVDNSVTVTVDIGANQTVHATKYGVCVRGLGWTNHDFPLVKATINPGGTTLTRRATFAAGSYAYYACVLHYKDWQRVGPIKRFTVIPQAPVGNLKGWQQIYVTNFRGNALDANWHVYNQSASGAHPLTSWYLASNTKVAGGKLTLSATAGVTGNGTRVITTGGAGLWYLPGLSPYEKLTVRVRIDADPVGYGATYTNPITGITSRQYSVAHAWMLWPFRGGWPQTGEIDMNEDFGGARTGANATTHWMSDNPANHSSNHIAANFTKWHILSVESTPADVKYFVDNKLVADDKADSTHLIPNTPMLPILQLEGVAPSDSLFSGKRIAEFDWLTLYKSTAH